MPVRIYEIAKQLGIESKTVLVKAKELGITAAKVPSSSLDKITAEYLFEQMGGTPAAIEAPVAPAPMPELKVVAEAPAPPVSAPEPVVEPEPVVTRAPERVVVEAPAPLPAAVVVAPVVAVTPPVVVPETPAIPAPVAAAPVPEIPPAPVAAPEPPKSTLGQKVGFIQLPTRPQPQRPPERGNDRGPQRPAPPAPAPAPGQQRPGFPQRPAFPQRPGAPQHRAPGTSFHTRGIQGGPAGRGGYQQQQQRPAVPAKPADPRSSLPSSARVVIFKPPITVRDLAEKLGLKPFQLIADLMGIGVFATVTQTVDETAAIKVCAKHGVKFEGEKREKGGGVVHAPVVVIEEDAPEKPEDLKPRPPVVTIMGHVDHGKTSLLDVIRKANVAAGEAGGITQHIGAYTIMIPHPERPAELSPITFLDTPGHAAFSSMRARGANVTDIVILVVAANDGVMPQTLEALSHAQAAKVPILVAVNKCDHPAANPLKVRQQLQEKGLVPDDWGGETIFCDVSALTKTGIDKLLEMIVLQADLLELKANPDRNAKGNVIESGLEPGGPTATVLVRKGTLRVGDIVLCDHFYGRVRALINEDGQRMKEAGPSHAVRVLGLNGVPEAGIGFSVVDDERAARDLAEEREFKAKEESQQGRSSRVTLENLFQTIAAEGNKVLKLIVKADTQGSAEAIVEALRKIETNKVKLEIIHDAVGTVTESDVILASASKAVVLGFHTRIDNGVSAVAKREGVQVKLYSIIYELIDQVKESMAGLLDPLLREVVVGSAEVRKVFALSKGGAVAGCAVTSGRIVRGKVRVMRKKGLIYEGVTQTLRRFQDEVNEVRAGMECGIRIEGFDDFQEGDVIETCTVEKIAQKL